MDLECANCNHWIDKDWRYCPDCGGREFREERTSISLCVNGCGCATHTIAGKCGKCGKEKVD